LVDAGLDVSRVHFGYVEDFRYREALWLKAVQDEVAKHVTPGQRVGLVGWMKDATSYYLTKFPQWGEHTSVPPVTDDRIVNATDIRTAFWEHIHRSLNVNGTIAQPDFVRKSLMRNDFIANDLFPSTQRILQELVTDPVQIHLAQRLFKIRKMRADMAMVGGQDWYRPSVCGDMMVTCSGHVLVIRRHDTGLIALPGGTFDPNRKKMKPFILYGDSNPRDTAIGECYEETQMFGISREALIRHIVDEYVFDDLDRDERGLYTTRVVHAALTERESGPPEVHAADDADEAWFMPYNQMDSREWYGDHYDMTKFMLARHEAR